MTEEQQKHYDKYIAKQNKENNKSDENKIKKQIGLNPNECTTEWHGGEMDNSGKSWIQPIGTYRVEHDCYIPKQCIHTLYILLLYYML